ncbi:hypothetical protein ACH5RR_032315 [Cinchona calisaya]|uniref:Srp40 C-terminal domain-containing protein n=1 Tax=Cinchona calisaya TaxID=153742 RepID=A0ABD2YIU8_9GENT
MIQGEKTSSISRLVALKPRQVLLAEQKQKQQGKLELQPTMAKKQLEGQLNQKTDTLNAELKLALLHSVIKYVNDKGFMKTFKRFLKEARVKDDDWKANSFDLEEMYYKYSENCAKSDANFKSQKEQDQSAHGIVEKDAGGDEDTPVETISKKKKKKKNENDNAKSAICELKTDESLKELIDKKERKSKLTSESRDENGTREESLHGVTGKPETLETMTINDNKHSVKTKSKDKSKKQKIEMVSPLEDDKGAENAVVKDKDATDIPLGDSKTKMKEKKKWKKDSVSEKLSDNGVENKGKSDEASENVATKESKKRRRSDSDESKDKPDEEAAIEESKRRKKGKKEASVAVKQAEVNKVPEGDGRIGGKTKEEYGTQKSSIEQFDKSINGLENNGVERSSAKKQHNGSIEPKTVNAFQRVKVDAVMFADDRLQDNSYWAKDGAEMGYGAKAQEVLGQVKGRDFRHEKTKKKRGSYRGGQIDLQSHSVKFSYSEEE